MKAIALPTTLAALIIAPATLSGQALTPVTLDSRLHAPEMTAHAAGDDRRDDGAGPPLPLPRLGEWVGFAKWLSLGSAAGFGTLGFVLKEDADRLFDRLESRCGEDAEVCRQRNADGSYADPVLEELFQRVVDRDSQAQLSLIGAQVAFGLTVAFFIADFQRDDGPGNIPYDPESEGERELELTVVPGELALRWYVD